MKIRNALWAGLAAAVPAVVVGTVASLLVPHVRGLGYATSLRLAVLGPSALLVATVAAYLGRPKLVVGIGTLAALAATREPVVVVVGVVLVLLVPRPPRRRARIVATAVFGALQIGLVLLALRTERTSAPRDPDAKYLTLKNGTRVHYVDEGHGETLLFLHGNPAWSYQWRDLVSALRGSYRCVALDYPGFGWSDAAPDMSPRAQSFVVEELVERLDLHDVTLVMQDWGGPIGLGFAGRHPERVRRVVLGSTWAWPTDPSSPRGKFSRIMGGPLGEFLQINFDAFAKLGLEHGVVRTLDPAELEGYLAPTRPIPSRGIAAYYPGQIVAATEYFDEVAAGLPRLADKSALIFWALRDEGFGRADLARWQRTFPQHDTLELPDANHFFFEDAIDQMVPKLRAFLEGSAVAAIK